MTGDGGRTTGSTIKNSPDTQYSLPDTLILNAYSISSTEYRSKKLLGSTGNFVDEKCCGLISMQGRLFPFEGGWRDDNVLAKYIFLLLIINKMIGLCIHRLDAQRTRIKFCLLILCTILPFYS